MPSNWLYIDTGFPAFTGEESAKQQISTIQNYLFMLVEQLRYSLRNLDLRNMNQTAVRQFEDALTTPIYARISDAEGNLTDIRITAEGLKTRIKDAEGNINNLTKTAEGFAAEIKSVNDDITTLTATAKGLAADIESANGNITNLTATANGIASSVSAVDGRVTLLQQKVDGFTLTAANGTKESTIALYSNGTFITSSTIKFDGEVVFASDLANGTTKISGDCISTGKIDVKYISLKEEMEVEYLDNRGKLRTGGYMGYVESKNYYEVITHGMGMMDANRAYQVVVTDSGARLTAIEDSWNRSEVVAATNITLDTTNNIIASTNISASSDRRKKEGILYDVGEKYLGLFGMLEPASFLYRDRKARRHMGFIAQDVLEAAEALGLQAEELALVSADEKGFYGLNYSELIPILWAKVKELDRKVKELTA